MGLCGSTGALVFHSVPKSIKTLTIEGSAIDSIASFYHEINRVFMQREDWKLAPSLDALDDLLFGGFGAINGNEPVAIIWRDMEASKAALGVDQTRSYYLAKRERPDIFDQGRIGTELAQLEAGTGPTYFDIIMDIIDGHPNIELRPG